MGKNRVTIHKNHILLSLIFCIALYLRLDNLGGHGYFIDEALFIGMVQHPSSQELIPSLIGKLSNTDDEFSTRLPFAIAGSLTVLALYWVIKNKDIALLIALLYAVMPILVFWSRLARPYAYAGLFVVLAWRYPKVMPLAILCTPIAIVGVNLTKIRENWKVYMFMVAVCVLIYFMRDDWNRGHFTMSNVLSSTRWMYIPCLTGLLYIGEILYAITRKRVTVQRRGG